MHAQFRYNCLEDYPSGLSNDYVGGRGGATYPNLPVSAARKRLGLLPRRQPTSFTDNISDEEDVSPIPTENEDIEPSATFELFSSEVLRALASRAIPIVDATHSNDSFRQALLEVINTSASLLPAIKRILSFGVQTIGDDGAILNRPRHEELWTQGKRFLWHALETLAANALFLDGALHRRANSEMGALGFREAWFVTGDSLSAGDASGHPYHSDNRRVGYSLTAYPRGSSNIYQGSR